MTLGEVQLLIRETFGAKDGSRGISGTFMWFVEEVGELSESLRGNRPKEHTSAEFADVLAWLATLANIADVDLEEAFQNKYGQGCPECRRLPCICGSGQKP